jgi:hypothetical protein
VDQRQEEIRRLLAKVEQAHDFVTDVDGYVYFAPSANGGHLSAWMLRALADELDKRNAPWDAIIANDPRIGTPGEL